MSALAPSAPIPAPGGARAAWRARGVLAAGALGGGLAAGALVESGHAWWLAGIAALILPVAVWRRPHLGPTVLLCAALTIEQFPYAVGPRYGTLTDRIPLFHGLSAGLHVNPADLAIALVLAVWLLRGRAPGAVLWPRTAVGRSMLCLAGFVALGVAVGQAHGGDLRTALTEVRPYAYLAATYLATAQLVRTREAVSALLFAFVLATGFKAAQGVLIFLLIRHVRPRPDAILGHEEALLFALFIFLVLALWLFGVRGRLRATATALLPVVLVADLANSRRLAWLILGVGCLVLACVTAVRLPERRRLLVGATAATALFLAVYLPIYWNHTGSLAQPARAVRSLVAPDPRDASSDLYRIQENANLRLNIAQGGLLGKGFGVPIDYALPIADIRDIDPLIAYVPHNGVLYVLMRMGLGGGIAFWTLLAAGVLAACRLVRAADRELAALGAVAVCGLVGWALQGYTDQGFFFYRIAFAVGCLLGVCEATLRLRGAATDVGGARRR